VEVDEGFPLVVYEFVPTSDRSAAEFVDEFRSDKARGKGPSPREERFPDLHDSISAFRTFEDAHRRWKQIADRFGADKVRLGPYVARIELEPGQGFKYEDSEDPTGHLYVQGDPVKLVEAVADVAHVASVPRD